MKRILTVLAVLIFSQMACELPGATIQQEAGSAGPAGTPVLLPTGETPEPPENAAGAVYELPSNSVPTPAPLCAIVTAAEALNLRSAPREGAPHITYMLTGEQVRVIEPAGSWWRVTNSRGETGYANARYLQEAKCRP